MEKPLEKAILDLRQIKPLVLCLTNYVTMDFVANSLLALGAASIMSCDVREFEELIKIAHALYINIGTLDKDFIQNCEAAIALSKQYHKPIILDPVGAGASAIRTVASINFAKHASIIRGNASEILALNNSGTTKGVESIHSVEDAKNAAEQLAKRFGCTIAISGKEDYITNGIINTSLNFGSPLMPLITGMGCALTAVIAAFRGVIENNFEAASIGSAYFSLCGSKAHKDCKGPGEFKRRFIDNLYSIQITESDIS